MIRSQLKCKFQVHLSLYGEYYKTNELVMQDINLHYTLCRLSLAIYIWNST